MAAPPPQSYPYDYLFKILIIGDASVGKVRFGLMFTFIRVAVLGRISTVKMKVVPHFFLLPFQLFFVHLFMLAVEFHALAFYRRFVR